MEKGETTEFKLNLRGKIETVQIPEFIDKLGGLVTNLNVQIRFGNELLPTDSKDESDDLINIEENREPVYAGKEDFFEFAEKSKISMYDRRFASQSWTVLARPYFLQRKAQKHGRPRSYNLTNTERNYVQMRLPENLFNKVPLDDPRLDDPKGYYDFEANARALSEYATELAQYKRSHFNAGHAIVRFWLYCSNHAIGNIDKPK